ncbi:fatty-acid amide hydrolase 2-B-like isoform X2 [Planococcus citri]
MELIARFIFSLTVYFGWIASPVYTILALRPKKHLPPPKQPEILDLSAVALAKKIRNKELTSEQVTKAFIERCREVNGDLNAIVEERFAAAIEEAKNVDRLIQSDTLSGREIETEKPLLGVPITVKEACKVEGLSHSVGAKLRKGVKAEENGDAVANLRKAGAIPLAVTNTPELCCSVETYNSVTGYTCNPYDLRRSCGGSSGGEAVLIASSSSPLGIGSDFAGSIRMPCLFTGIFGHKPTAGVVSNKGHFPDHADKEFQKLLNIGPMSRYAQDLKPALKIIAGSNADALNLDQTVNLNDLQIYYMLDKGFMYSEISVDSTIKNAIQNSAKYFQATHGCFVQQIDLPEMQETCEICVLQTAEVEGLKQVFCLKDNPKDECSVIMEFLKLLVNKSDYSIQLLLNRFIVESCLFIPTYKKYKYATVKNNLMKRLKETLGDNGVLLFPTFATPAHYKYQLVWKLSSLGYPMIVNVLGFPATQVPLGLNKSGLPVGFQVIAAPHQDRLCLAVAEELEKAFGGWIPPTYSS